MPPIFKIPLSVLFLSVWLALLMSTAVPILIMHFLMRLNGSEVDVVDHWCEVFDNLFDFFKEL